MTKIKICGLSRIQDIDAVNASLPDYVGFVFADGRRQINEKRAKELKARLNPLIKVVGVFVDEYCNHIIKLCNSHVIDLIQLHGNENEDYIRRLRSYVSNHIIKAIPVKSPDAIKRVREYSCDYLLFDSYQEGAYGGHGKSFDWSLLSGFNRPYFLAGGLNSGNLEQALKQCSPYCVDVSSGVETDGMKDPNKIIELVTRVRQISNC